MGYTRVLCVCVFGWPDTVRTLIPPDSPSLAGALQPSHRRPAHVCLPSQLGYTVAPSELGTHWASCPPGTMEVVGLVHAESLDPALNSMAIV